MINDNVELMGDILQGSFHITEKEFANISKVLVDSDIALSKDMELLLLERKRRMGY